MCLPVKTPVLPGSLREDNIYGLTGSSISADKGDRGGSS